MNIPNVVACRLVDSGIYVLSVYRSPSFSGEENLNLLNFLEDFTSDKEVVLM